MACPDEAAATAVASVDAARLQNVGQLYRAAGLPPEEADAQAFLFYCFIFGQSLSFLERVREAHAIDRKIGRETAFRSRIDAAGPPGRTRKIQAWLKPRLSDLVAFAVIAAALLDPFQAAIAAGGLLDCTDRRKCGSAPCRRSPWNISERWHSGRPASAAPRARQQAPRRAGLRFAGAAGAAAGAAGAAAASAPQLALRKSFHFLPSSVPASLAAWYFALHSFAVRACAGEIAANAANPDTAIAQSIFA